EAMRRGREPISLLHKRTQYGVLGTEYSVREPTTIACSAQSSPPVRGGKTPPRRSRGLLWRNTQRESALTPDERLLLIEELWDSLTADPANVPLTDAQRADLQRRLDAYRDHPKTGSTWDEF